MKPNSKDNPIEGKVKITHYECVKDGKVILSSDKPQEVDSVDDFKKRVKLLIICDKVNVEFRKIDTDG